jgi:hypothetical protein
MGVLAVLFSHNHQGEGTTNVHLLLQLGYSYMKGTRPRLSHYLYFHLIYQTLSSRGVPAHDSLSIYWPSFVPTGAMALLRGAQPMAWTADALEDAVSGTLHSGMDLFPHQKAWGGGMDSDQPHAHREGTSTEP